MLLWFVDDAAAHGADHDDASLDFLVDHVSPGGPGEEECAVYVDVEHGLEFVEIVVFGWGAAG